jgi:hypothetical protein
MRLKTAGINRHETSVGSLAPDRGFHAEIEKKILKDVE